MKIIFTLPQLRDHSYISVVNQSVSQSVNNSIRNRSLSPNSSLVKNSSISYDHVKTSSPNKEENKVPKFSPPLEKNIIKDDSILQGANHKVRIDARDNSSICSPQIKPLEWQNDGVNSRHGSGIDSPRKNILSKVNAPSMGEQGNYKAPNMGEQGNYKAPNIGEQGNFKAPNMGEQGNFKAPNMGEQGNFNAPNMGD